MKMSDIFPLPLDPTIPAGETLAFGTTGEAAEAAVHAVNHHDALVAALEDVCDFEEDAISRASILLDEINKNDK